MNGNNVPATVRNSAGSLLRLEMAVPMPHVPVGVPGHVSAMSKLPEKSLVLRPCVPHWWRRPPGGVDSVASLRFSVTDPMVMVTLLKWEALPSGVVTSWTPLAVWEIPAMVYSVPPSVTVVGLPERNDP